MKKIYFTAILFYIISLVNAQEKSDSSKPLTVEALYIGDVCGNVDGGIKKGVGYLGMGNLRLGFNTQNARLWKGGQFFINGAATHGDTPSSKLIGDYQVASNIEAGNHIYLHELWYKQTLSRFEFTVGLQDLNVDFIASECGSNYLNSSFGVPALISDNIPVPIFPLTNLGISAKINFTDSFVALAGIFDGCPTGFNNNTFNTNWKFNSNDGTFLISELQLSKTIQDLSGVYKFGSYYHTGHVTLNRFGDKVDGFNYNYGFYGLLDQQVWNGSSEKSVSLFGQVALSPKHINNLHYYYGGGITANGLFKSFDNTLGLAVAHSRFHSPARNNETAIELFVRLKLTDYLSVQPDFQYIINPMGFETKLSNAFVTMLRFGINI